MTSETRRAMAHVLIAGSIALALVTWADPTPTILPDFGTPAALAFNAAGQVGEKTSRVPHGLTFNKDIAPIIFHNCAVCHHPGGPGPFSLLTYEDVKKHAQQIVVVTGSRYMPPWLPAPGYDRFVGERRLTDQQIASIKQWVEEGAVEGIASDLPPAPQFNEGWQLGKPDLIVKLPQPYTLRASGSDVFRNFVFRVPVTTTRFVKAVEILPGNKKVIHHANILVDRTGSSRRLDGQDGEPGFGGMELEIESESFEPQTHFLFWKPGTPAVAEPDGLAWRLEKGTDLVLNTHMQPSGKPELIQPSIGLYFTDKPPTEFPMLLQLEHDSALDIPAGAKDFVVTDEFKLPVDVKVLAVYPHAHYLGRDIQGFATLPDGEKKWLIRIRNWDLNWQAVYRYAEPIALPRGTVIGMRYTYDNSAENPRNPNHPPQRVVAGNRSSDEMAHLWLQVLPRHRDDLKVLQASLMEQRLQKDPNDFTAHFNLGAVLQSEGKLDQAIVELRRALGLRPGDVTALNNLGAALEAQGKFEEAVTLFQQAVVLRPDYANARYNLANTLLDLGKPDEAIRQFQQLLQAQPDDADVHNNVGRALASEGKLEGAVAEFQRALRLDPDHAGAHYNLGTVFAKQGNLAQAAVELRAAIELDPRNAGVHNDLGTVFALEGDFKQAAAEFEAALQLDPGLRTARENLDRARARLDKKN